MANGLSLPEQAEVDSAWGVAWVCLMSSLDSYMV